MKLKLLLSTATLAVITTLLLQTPVIANDFTNSIGMKFKEIPSGSFMMGSDTSLCPKDDPFTSTNEYKNCFNNDELPYHKVKIKSFYMASTEVTQMQYYKIMGKNPSWFKTERLGYDSRNNPVEHISWNDANEFIKKLNKKEGTDKYRLPTEEEWEYSARAGSTTKWFFGNDKKQLKKYAWYSKNAYDVGEDSSNYGTHPVAKKKANKFGLYDIYGNVQELVNSCYTKNYNDKGCRKGDYKSIRGGDILNIANDISSVNRNGVSKKSNGGYNIFLGDFIGFYGFRVAMTK